MYAIKYEIDNKNKLKGICKPQSKNNKFEEYINVQMEVIIKKKNTII